MVPAVPAEGAHACLVLPPSGDMKTLSLKQPRSPSHILLTASRIYTLRRDGAGQATAFRRGLGCVGKGQRQGSIRQGWRDDVALVSTP